MFQTENVLIIRVITKNSHDMYRDAKQFDKFIIDFAIQIYFFEVEYFFVELLNEVNKYVIMIQQSDAVKKLQHKFSFEFFEKNHKKFIKINIKFFIVQNFNKKSDTVAFQFSNFVIFKRKRQASARYANIMLIDDVYQSYDRAKKKRVNSNNLMNQR